jgi:hypothetical protein
VRSAAAAFPAGAVYRRHETPACQDLGTP